jgi:hypothetical protein
VKVTTEGFLARAVGWFNEQGITCRRILSDNGSAYSSGEWRKACKALDLNPTCTQGCLKDDHEVLEAIATLPSASIPSMS